MAMNRRHFMKHVAGYSALALPGIEFVRTINANAQELRRQNKSVIIMWMGGGPATIDIWDLKPEAPEGIRGEFKPADTNVRGIQISEHMTRMAKHADKVTIVRSLYHTIPSHGPATTFMTTGNKPIPSIQYPAMGSLCSKLLDTPTGVPAYVSFSDLDRKSTRLNSSHRT